MIEQDLQREYSLPVTTLRELDETELAFYATMSRYQPDTQFRVGDLAIVHRLPSYLRAQGHDRLPTYWQVRMVVSLWTYESWSLGNALRLDGRWSDAIAAYNNDFDAMMRDMSSIPSWKAKKAVIYAHGFPHGMWPNTAAWFFDGHLTRDYLRSTNEEWELILDEAHTPYVGIAPEAAMNGFALDLAPDRYGDGHKLHRPFSFEENAFHSLSCLGSEEAAVRGIDPRVWSPQRTESGLIIL